MLAGHVGHSRLMKNGVCPDSIGAGSLRASFFLARKKLRGMVERFFSTLLGDGVVVQLGQGKRPGTLPGRCDWTSLCDRRAVVGALSTGLPADGAHLGGEDRSAPS